MKTTTTLIAFILFATFGFSQINSNPGIYNWTDPSAWSGGVVPTSSDVVNITSNSTINLDVAINRNADINVLPGGALGSSILTNDLTLNSANLTITNGQVAFAGGVAAVPITINDGVVINNGFYTSGDLYLSYLGATLTSQNNGDFMVSGDMELDDVQIFDNNLAIFVSGVLLINTNSVLNNNQMTNAGSFENDGSLVNVGSVSITDSIMNNAGASISSSGSTITTGTNFINSGSVTISDSTGIGASLMNYGTYTNNGGAVGIQVDFYNYGTITGSSNGNYWIQDYSFNDAAGIINGSIDICDATLGPNQYMDDDQGTGNIDFNNVTFCTINIATIKENDLGNLIISPNPTVDIIYLNGVAQGSFAVHGIDGRMVLSGSFDASNNSVNLGNLPSGTYQLTIISANDAINSQIVKL